MPAHYHVNRELGLILVQGEGVLCDEDLRSLNTGLTADPAIRECAMELDDWRAVTRNDVSSACLRALAESWNKRDLYVDTADAKVAAVAPRDVEFGLNRMYQMFRSGSPVEFGLFREMEEAEAWLGLPRGYTQRRAQGGG